MAESFSSPILDELHWRGFVKDITHPELDEVLEEESVTLYCGFDPTAKSLHVGNMIGLMALAHFYRHGHQAIAVVGGATGLVGDPSGKDEEREFMDTDRLESNLASISAQMQTFLDRVGERGGDSSSRVEIQGVSTDEESDKKTSMGHFSTSTSEARGTVVRRDVGTHVEVLNNADWLQGITFLDFLRDVGKCFSVNAMMAKDSVRTRLEEREHGISFTEFSYMLMQAYDFLHLYDERGCRLQIGGSDQWGNITAGTDLIGRKSSPDGEQAFGLTFPLLTTAEGKKFGKSVEGAVFLDAEMTSPYDFYQFWVNVDDRDCGRLLRLFTFLPRHEIQSMEQTIEDGENRGEVQRRLASEVTSLVHGEEEVQKVVRASKMLFGEKIEGLSDDDLRSIFSDVPSTEIPRQRLRSGEFDVIDAFVDTDLQRSRGATRRLIKQGGAYLNNVRIEDRDRALGEQDLASETMMVLRSGKKNYHVLRFVEE